MNIFQLPHGVPVLETVARHLLATVGDDPAALSRALVFLPTRRAARALGAAFLRVGDGRPMLLPRMVAIGDIDENPLFASDAAGLRPAIPPLVREARLAALITGHDPTITPDRALALAAELGALLDEAAEREVDLSDLARLAPDRFARHWQRNLAVISLATGQWRQDLAARGAMEPVARRVAVLHRLAARLAAAPPPTPLLAVGITAPAPAPAALLRAIASAPQGTVLLPGLDVELPGTAWCAIGPSHPQAELRALLERLGLERTAVGLFPCDMPAHAPRARLLSRAMLPADALDWQAAPPGEESRGLTLLAAPDSATEARAIALAVREALEARQARIAVITPDRALAERVAASLARFGIAAADSAAMPLGRTPPGALLRLLAQAVARDLAPVPLLSLLRHPLVSAGMQPAAFRAAGRNFERAALRGPRRSAATVLTAAAIDRRWYRTAGRQDRIGIRRLQRAVTRALLPLQEAMQMPRAPATQLLRATVAAAEAFGATGKAGGAGQLWQGPEGAALARHVLACDTALTELPPIAPASWPDLLDQLLAGASVRARRHLAGGAAAQHPRVEILGVLEARLLDHDVRILAGLNEGTWPALAEPGPWLSRAQRDEIGLASPDAMIGFAAADFVAAACAAPRVILARAARVEGEPAVASRWLTRLGALAGEAALAPETDHVALAALLDRGLPRKDEPRPCPRPRVPARPRSLPVTAIETLRRNPYAIYAQRILRLHPLDPLDQEADAADWGSLVHDVAARFFSDLARDPSLDAEAAFLRHGDALMRGFQARPGLIALWRPRLATLAPWFAAQFAGRPDTHFVAETDGQRSFALAGGDFILTARADLIARGPDGRLTLIDFKTGTAPSKPAVGRGEALQLPLSALIAEGGGFRGVAAARVARLAYALLPGGAEPGEVHAVAEDQDVDATMAQAERILAALVARYADPAECYRAMPEGDDFAHLSRQRAWGEVADAEDAA
jgi:ATP-dependent helicase/nuclease subunit B